MQNESAAVSAAEKLVAALDNPLAFGHPLRYLRLIETHISWIILTGDYAYKIKKPVAFGFLDFSTLEKRRFYCEEELRLNRRFAPEIYLELVPIRGSSEHPRLHGEGEPIEYAIKMLEFSQQDLLSAYAADGRLEASIIDAMADTISAIHSECEPAAADSAFGTASSVAHWSEENLDQLAATLPADYLPPAFHRLEDWYLHQETIAAEIEARRRDGHVRECHGDLHLGNLALLGGRVTLFDCIEFNPELRWIDTISETAFVVMDLQARGYPGYGWRFLNRYLQAGGDYAGVRLLRYYLVYRALVRAKVETLRAAQDTDELRQRIAPALDYIELACHWADDLRPGLILMHGLSGSGKSTVARQLVEAIGALQLRSDIERKRLFGLAADARSDSALEGGIYTAEASDATYARLRELARTLIEAGYCVIVDAAFLHAGERAQLLELEASQAFERVIVQCEAPEEVLRQRILARRNDPSEADLDVLARQLETAEAISADERSRAGLVRVGADGLQAAQIDAIRALLAS